MPRELIRVRPSDLFGFDKTTKALRAMAMSLARTKLENANIADMTDNSTGTAAALTVALAIPGSPFDGTVAGASPAAAFNTAMDAYDNACRAIAETFNDARYRIGLPRIVSGFGTFTADTVPALTKVLTTTSGALAIDFTTGAAAMSVARNNFATLAKALNELISALGETFIAENSGGSPSATLTMTSIPTATAGTGATAGLTSISDAVMDAFLTALADNVATLVARYNALMFQAGLTDITDSSGGTASATHTIPSMGTITPYTTAGTDLAPKAGFDTEVGKWENNFADLVLRLNLLRSYHGLPLVTDSTGATANTTIEAILVDLTAVDGTGSNGLAAASALTTWNAVKANVATLAAAINDLTDEYGLQPIIDDSGGVADIVDPITVVNVPASGAGVAGAALSGVADAEVDANLVVLRNAFATMAAKINAMTGTEVQSKGLDIVAA